MIRLIFNGALILLMAASTGASITEDKFAINLVVSGADPGVGQVLVSLFDSSETYMRDPMIEAEAAVNSEGRADFDLGKHSPGEYAVVVIYDKNGNGKLDTGLFRIPKEKIGFSNNAKGRIGPAKWNDARFFLSDSDIRIDVQLKKAKRDQ